LNGELKKAFSAPERVKRLESQGVVASTSTPQEFAALIRKDLVLGRKVVKDAVLDCKT
jgi:tripartite-type tricarboxylate transporter receptor subunit TctC